MDTTEALDVMYQTFRLAMEIALPLLLASMVIGILVAVFSAATQINEQTLTFVPKLIVIVIMLAVLGGTILTKMQDFTIMIFNFIVTG
ncbi:flagellar biosynthetic protein FliQ [Oribacterium sp. HCP28S3_H8]|jgi:flagellar biosynthetic protein FliQ|uniref:flagellar biosynthetic protein FliQ n=1 Tax=Oribacterium sp. HCP28S3_H8 TaxID=3438945 RepID=UPI003F8C6FE0